MARREAEQSNALKLSWLKEKNCIPKESGIMSGVITWTFGMSENKNRIRYTVVIDKENGSYIQLDYTHTDRYNDEKSEMDYKIPLTTTPCNYGGKRYWFICSLSKNDHYCGRRVGVLYLIGKYYGCRHCGNIAYSAQAEGKRYRGFTSICAPDIEKAETKVKRKFYNGNMTRKYRRLIEMERKFETNLFMMDDRLMNSYKRITLPKSSKKRYN